MQSGQWGTRALSVVFYIYVLQFKPKADRRLSFTTAGSLYRVEILRHTVEVALLVFTSIYLRDKNVQLKFFTQTEEGVLLVKVHFMWPPVKYELTSLLWSKLLASVRRLLLLFGAMQINLKTKTGIRTYLDVQSYCRRNCDFTVHSSAFPGWLQRVSG